MAKKLLSLLSAVVCLTCLLSSCSGNKFSVDEGRYIDKKTNIAYIDAPACYEPIERGDTVYGKIDSVELFEIVGANPQKWLCEGTGIVFYAEGVTLPALDEMNIAKTQLLIDDATSVELSAADSAKIISFYSDGESIARPLPAADKIETSVVIRFADEELGLYYSLSYMKLTEDYIFDGNNCGKYFVFNRFENKCVAIDGTLDAYVAAAKQ